MPRLVRFYGGDPLRWLAELPLGIVRACSRMLPKLEAEEAESALAVRSGRLTDEGFASYMRRWAKSREGDAGGRPGQRLSPAQLAAHGIGFRRIAKAARG